MRMGFSSTTGSTAAAAPLPHMIPKSTLRHCYCNSGSSSTSPAAAVRWRPQLSRPPVPVPPQVLLPLRRPQQPSPANNPRPLPTKPSPRRPVVDAPDHSSHDDDDGDECSSSSSGRNVKNSSCTPTDVLRLMDVLQLPVDEDLYVSLIKECAEYRDAAQGDRVYAHIRRSLPDLLRGPAGLHLANRLLFMFAACGQQHVARQLFDQMHFRDATSLAVVIAALSASGSHGDALRLFVEMCVRSGGRSPVLEPGVCWLEALVTVLRSCARTRELGFGRQVHGLALKVLGGDDAVLLGDVGESLIQFYSRLGHHGSAVKLFEGTRSQSAAAWTCMISGYSREGRFKEAIGVFREMGRAGRRKNCHVFSSTLSACAKMGDGGWSGKQVHAAAIKLGTSSDGFVCSSLVDMYMKHELPTEAQRAFATMDGMRDCVCWKSLLIGYARSGCGMEAVKLLYEMKAAGINLQESIVHEAMTALDIVKQVQET
ncbi:pentatricopeptide repeat-containing protein At1g31790-like [Musa acuminata AAA Group]|uniref:pentatricopeptide repeat-containing protein At1g31790-like n=1 Tax=Musa acuminata AAA Group TaxID=214697 RepID=UPI0031D14E9D